MGLGQEELASISDLMSKIATYRLDAGYKVDLDCNKSIMLLMKHNSQGFKMPACGMYRDWIGYADVFLTGL